MDDANEWQNNEQCITIENNCCNFSPLELILYHRLLIPSLSLSLRKYDFSLLERINS